MEDKKVLEIIKSKNWQRLIAIANYELNQRPTKLQDFFN